MLKRKIEDVLLTWKQEENHKPIVIKGCRQCGKTFSVMKFAHEKYQHVVFIALGLVGSIAIVWLLKYLVSRPRPPEMYHLVESYGASFPSAHSMYAATLGCLAIYLSRKHPQHHIIWFCAVLWLVIMGLSRVYLGVHFPSDVLAGWSISFIWISLLYLGYAKFSRAKTN